MDNFKYKVEAFTRDHPILTAVIAFIGGAIIF